MLGLLWLLQRRVGRRQRQRRDGAEIVVRGRRSLGSKAQLVIVETDDARYVLGVTEHGVNLIERMPAEHVIRPVVHPAPAPSGVAADPSSPSSFDELLAAEAAAPSSQAPTVPSLRRHRQQPRRPDPLQGSILSSQTWRQTIEFMRRGR